jgi:hypothetical protein
MAWSTPFARVSPAVRGITARVLFAYHDKFGLHDSAGVLEKSPNLGLGHRIGSDVEHFRDHRPTRLFNGRRPPGGFWSKLGTDGCDLAI